MRSASAALHNDVPHHNLYRAVKNTRDEQARQSLGKQQDPMPTERLPEQRQENADPKSPYATPSLVRLGNVKQVTEGGLLM